MIHERGILFTKAMIRRILDGRKTQTRRPVPLARLRLGLEDVPDKVRVFEAPHNAPMWRCELRADALHGGLLRCPYGGEGDYLYARETFRVVGREEERKGRSVVAANLTLAYAATPDERRYIRIEADRWTGVVDAQAKPGLVWRSPLLMPRWAARIELKLTAPVRAERLRSISREDILAESVDQASMFELVLEKHGQKAADRALAGLNPDDALECWRRGFCALHDPSVWALNPWLFALTFESRVVPSGVLRFT